MKPSLLSHRINTLLLDANKSFPSQTQDSKEMINAWRRTQRCRLVGSDGTRDAGVPDDRDHLVGDGPLEDNP